MWPNTSSSGEKVKVRGRVGVGARWGPPTPAESAPVLLAAVTPLREELPLAAFAVGEWVGAWISTAGHGKAVSFPDRHPMCPPPCLGRGKGTVTGVCHLGKKV